MYMCIYVYIYFHLHIVRVALAHLFVVPERDPHPTQEQHFSTIFSLFKSSSLFIMHISTQNIS